VEAAARAQSIAPVLAELAGMSAHAIAAELNRRKVETPTGGPVVGEDRPPCASEASGGGLMLAKGFQADFCSRGAREWAFAPPSTSYFPRTGAGAHPLTLWLERHNNGCILDDRPCARRPRATLPLPNPAKKSPANSLSRPGPVEWLRIDNDY
jgi:hypothetical protein